MNYPAYSIDTMRYRVSEIALGNVASTQTAWHGQIMRTVVDTDAAALVTAIDRAADDYTARASDDVRDVYADGALLLASALWFYRSAVRHIEATDIRSRDALAAGMRAWAARMRDAGGDAWHSVRRAAAVALLADIGVPRDVAAAFLARPETVRRSRRRP